MKNLHPIYLSSWSVKNLIAAQKFNLHQLPKFALDNGFQGVEFIDRHFPNSTMEFQLQLLAAKQRTRLDATLGLTTDFTIQENTEQKRQIKYVLNMLDFAAKLEARSIRILLGGTDSIFQKWAKKFSGKKRSGSTLESIKRQKALTSKLQCTRLFFLLHKILIQSKKPRPFKNEKIKRQIIDALGAILPTAEKYKLNLAIENHWGVTACTENILHIVNFFNSQFLGTCPDFGNFTVHQNKYDELKKLLPFAKEIHAKSYQFNTDGEETSINYSRCIELVKSSNFEGPLVVEYEGNGDQVLNSLTTRALILKYL